MIPVGESHEGKTAPPSVSNCCTPAILDCNMTGTPGLWQQQQHHPDATGSSSPFFYMTQTNNHSNPYDEGSDAFLAKEMNALSVEERTKVFDEIHGVAAATEETPKFIQSKIDALKLAIQEIPNKERKHLNLAFFLRPTLEANDDFKLQFLRSEEYHPQRTAERMVRYFDLKVKLFGPEKVAKTIILEEDLSDKDLDVYRLGYVTSLPQTDQIQRPVMFCDSAKIDFDRMTVDSILRCYFYLVQSTVETTIAQTKGVCCLVYSHGNALALNPEIMKKTILVGTKGSHLIQCMPIRYSGFHFCYDDPKMDFLIRTLRVASGKSARLRLRAHFGTAMENEYKLMTFGIRGEGILRRSGEGDTTMFHDYIERRKRMDGQILQQEKEELERLEELENEETNNARKKNKNGSNTTTTTTKLIAYPRSMDVLIFRGYHRDQHHPGNELWHKSIGEHLERYLNCKHGFEKTHIATVVVQIVLDKGGRFLQQTPRGWKLLSEKLAREKATTAFRNKSKLLPAPPTTTSSTTTTPTTTETKVNNNNKNNDYFRPRDYANKRIRYDPCVTVSNSESRRNAND